jgi:hypothetical protein
MKEYQLKLASGQVVTWQGKSGEDAARRYVDIHRDAAVIGWRVPPHGLAFGLKPIAEPGNGRQ